MEKNILDSKLYRWLEVFATYFFLNIAWLVACIPVVTVFPATAALFAVVRDRVNDREAGSFLRAFFGYFRENFKQSLAVGVVWTLLGLFLVLDFRLAGGTPPGVRAVVYAVLFCAGLVYAATSVYLFPVMVNYDTDWKNIIRNSFLIALSQLPTTFVCLVVVAASVAIIAFFPTAVLILVSVAAYAVYRLCDRAFQKVADARS